MKTPDKKQALKLTGSAVGIIAAIFLARAWYHSTGVDAQPYLDEEPQQTAVEPETEPTEPEATEPEPEQPTVAEPTSEARDAANVTWTALRRHVLAYAWELSKLPTDELNNLCWMNRPDTQMLQDEFDGGTAIKPSEFVGHEDLLLKDIACRMAAHYDATGDAPDWATTDISTLEGMPDEWRETKE